MAHPSPALAILQPEAIDLLKPQSLSPKSAPRGRAETEITVLTGPEECSRILDFPFLAHNSIAGLRRWWGKARWACEQGCEMGVKGIRKRKNPDCLRCEVEERGHGDKTGKGNGGLGMASFCILFTQGRHGMFLS